MDITVQLDPTLEKIAWEVLNDVNQHRRLSRPTPLLELTIQEMIQNMVSYRIRERHREILREAATGAARQSEET